MKIHTGMGSINEIKSISDSGVNDVIIDFSSSYDSLSELVKRVIRRKNEYILHVSIHFINRKE